MPLDHFVSQVHLKQFTSPVLGNRMYALRKSDMKAFTPDASSVCRILDGSTNAYLSEERVVEGFLKGIEPKYNKAIANVAADLIDAETIYVLAGFIAYVYTCSPAGMRIHSEQFRGEVEESARILDEEGVLSAPPPELGGASLTELIQAGKACVEIDPKYPQAVGITSIFSLIKSFGNFSWDILLNEYDDSPFFTSDFPIAIEKTNDIRILNKLVPLCPTLAVRICPVIRPNTNHQSFTFSDFRYKIRRPQRHEISKINALLVRCAETTVFYRDNHDWIQRFVQKHSAFRVELRTQRIPHDHGSILWKSLGVFKV